MREQARANLSYALMDHSGTGKSTDRCHPTASPTPTTPTNTMFTAIRFMRKAATWWRAEGTRRATAVWDSTRPLEKTCKLNPHTHRRHTGRRRTHRRSPSSRCPRMQTRTCATRRTRGSLHAQVGRWAVHTKQESLRVALRGKNKNKTGILPPSSTVALPVARVARTQRSNPTGSSMFPVHNQAAHAPSTILDMATATQVD